jgi:uncharacterized protein YndB with AHSA1/START domain
MAKLEKSITVNAPIEKIFNYISDQTHLPEIWPSLVEITDIKPLPNGGTTNRWKYKMAGIRLSGTSEDTEYVTNKRLVSKTKGGVDSIQTWTFQPEGGGTRVTFGVEYTLPVPVLGKLAEAIILKMNEREGKTILENLKAIMEG